MRVLILTVGSRGDVEPFCALAHEILTTAAQAQSTDDEHEPTTVDFFVQPELESLLPTTHHDKLRIHTWPFTQQDFYAFVQNPTHGVNHENPRVRFVGIVADLIGNLVLPQCSRVCQVAAAANANAAQVIVTSALARSLALAVGTKYDIPVALVHLQPLLPTDLFPHYSQTDDCVEAIMRIAQEKGGGNDEPSRASDGEYRDTYVTLERFQYDFLKENLDPVYEELNLPEQLTFDANMEFLCGEDAKVGIFNCFSNDLIPSVAVKGINEKPNFVFEVGAISDSYIPASFDPESLSGDLLEFLKQRPVCVGYGSMPFDRLTILLDALEAAGKPALLVGKAMNIAPNDGQSTWIHENIRQVDALPYAWLLPQCSMMLSHGGAGVLHATLRAGVPPVITPLMGDQFSWAQLVEAKGLGVRAGGSLPSVTKEDIETAIQRAENECADKAKACGQAMRNRPEGVRAMSRILARAAHDKEFTIG